MLDSTGDEAIIPGNNSIIVGGNTISVEMLDLSGKFEVIQSQLERIANTLKIQEC